MDLVPIHMILQCLLAVLLRNFAGVIQHGDHISMVVWTATGPEDGPVGSGVDFLFDLGAQHRGLGSMGESCRWDAGDELVVPFCEHGGCKRASNEHRNAEDEWSGDMHDDEV